MPGKLPPLDEITEPPDRPWFLYLIECQDGSLYAGITTDVDARYAAHVSGKGARYTRSHTPARLLGVVQYPDRSSASKAEHWIKQLKPADKRLFICGRLSPTTTNPTGAA